MTFKIKLLLCNITSYGLLQICGLHILARCEEIHFYGWSAQ